MDRRISKGAKLILGHMDKYDLLLNGDPSADLPFVFQPVKVRQKMVTEGVEAPAAACRELLDSGLIESVNESASTPRIFRVSEAGNLLLKVQAHSERRRL